MSKHNWIILTALEMEAEALRADLEGVHGMAVEVIGPKAAGFEAEMLRGCQGVILAGLAGGLDPVLKIGDVIMDAKQDERIAQLPVVWGKIFTADRVISTPAEKAKLFAETGASAVDMESGIAAGHAAAAGVPLIVIRAISDSAADTVPPEILKWVDSKGRPRPATIALALIRKPSLLKDAQRLRENSKLALKNLLDVVRRVVSSLGG